MLNRKEKDEILKYHTKVCHYLIRARKDSQRVPADNRTVYATKRLEGRLIAIRALVDFFGLPEDFLPNRDSIII